MLDKKDITVLSIDDEAFVQESISEFLKDNGYRVLLAGNGKVGLEVFRSKRPDIVLVDLRMPEIDGLDVLAAVTKESPETPLIVISGTGDIQDVIDALRLGAWDYLVKPISDLLVLDHAIEKCLERALLLKENKRYREHLEEEVKNRTADLEIKTEELLNAKEAAEEANLAKSRFLTTMSHELRTPINGVLGMAQLALLTDLTDQQRYYIEIITQSGRALLEILNQILDLSRIEANKIDLEEIEFNLGESLESIVRLFSGSAEAKGLSLNCRLPVHIPVDLIGDPIRLNQVLSNLIANALKFTESGEITITVNKLKETAEEVELFFGVSDTGIGISQEKLETIFQPFSQVDNSTTRKYGGTGLGLTIVKNLVEIMGGRISVESREGDGSTFWVTLPLKKQVNAGGNLIKAPVLEGYKVLIVNGFLTSREYLRSQLIQWQATVDQAVNAEEATTLLRRAYQKNAPYDCVIADYQLIDMNAVKLADAANAEGYVTTSQFIIITSIQFDDVRKECAQRGIKHCLLKPIIRSSVLLNALQDVFGIREVAPEITVAGIDFPEEEKNQLILIVEDDPVNQQVIVGMLEKLGYSVDIAADGKEAISYCKKKPYHMIFMDCLMPEMDGFEATCTIRNMEKSGELNGHMPIIAFTAKAMKGDRELCLVAGMDDYLTKPIKLEDLQKMTRKYIRK